MNYFGHKLLLKIEYTETLFQGWTKKWYPAPPSNYFKERTQIGKKAFQRERDWSTASRKAHFIFLLSPRKQKIGQQPRWIWYFCFFRVVDFFIKKPSMGIFSFGVHKKAEYFCLWMKYFMAAYFKHFGKGVHAFSKSFLKHCQRHYGPRRWLLWPVILVDRFGSVCL